MAPVADGDVLMLTVSDVKQLGYCARIVYYTYLLGGASRRRTRCRGGHARMKRTFGSTCGAHCLHTAQIRTSMQPIQLGVDG
jgi:hypothetical protein